MVEITRRPGADCLEVASPEGDPRHAMDSRSSRSGGPFLLLFGCLCALLLLMPLRAGALEADVADELRLSPSELSAEPPVQDSVFGSFLAGMIAESRGDYSAAADFMVHALSAEPDNAGLLMQAFMLNAAEGRIETAYALAERLQDLGHTDVASLLLLASRELEEKSPRDAREWLAQQPVSGLVELTRPVLDGWLAVADGEGEEALEALDDLGEEPGLQSLLTLHRALMLDVMGRQEEAASLAEDFLEDGQNLSLRLVWHLGNLLERAGQEGRADELYEEFQERNPDNSVLAEELQRRTEGDAVVLVPDAQRGFAEALFDFASLMAQEQAPIPALIHAQLSLHLAPELDTTRILIGEILQYQGRREAAIAMYESVPKDSPLAWSAQLRVAEELERLERHEAAAEKLRKLSDLRPERYEPLYRLGNLLRDQERFEEAAEVYGQALEVVGESQRQHWILYYFRAIAYERSDQWKAAEADFKRALELEADQPYVLNYLAYSWIEQQRNFEEAEEMLIRAVEREPDDGHITDSLGWLYYRLGDFTEAVVHLERAVELQPQDPVINDHLGDAYWRVNRQREAVVQWRRALSFDPEEDEIPIIERKIDEGLPDAEVPNAEVPDIKTPGNRAEEQI